MTKDRHLKSVDNVDQYLDELEMFRTELDKEFKKLEKWPNRIPTLMLSKGLFPYAHTLIQEYKKKGYKIEKSKALNIITIKFIKIEVEDIKKEEKND